MTARPPPADLSGHVGKLVLCEEFLQNAISAKDWYQVRFDKSCLSCCLSLVFRSIIDIQYSLTLLRIFKCSSEYASRQQKKLLIFLFSRIRH